MNVVFPFHQGDVAALRDLITWIGQLGGAKKNRALLVADAGTQWSDCVALRTLTSTVFGDVDFCATSDPISGWPAGPNVLFTTAAKRASGFGKPWLWMEPDAIPLHPDWIDQLEVAQATSDKPILARIYPGNKPGVPQRMMSGIAVYPPDSFLVGAEPFDVGLSRVAINQVRDTNLIQWFWGEPNLSPTFVEAKGPMSPINAFTLANLEPDAVLFHRCKDGSLTRLLRRKFGFTAAKQNLVVVLNVCNNDAALMLDNLSWQAELGGCPDHRAIVAYDPSLKLDMLKAIQERAIPLFRSLELFHYPPPRSSEFVHASRWAFRNVAMHVEQRVGIPFLWVEADMWPLKRGWIDALQSSYEQCGRPFFGSVVPDAGHFNGTAIYPPDTYSRCPSLREERPYDAFDTGMRDETAGKVCDASRLMQCAWVERNGKLCPHGSGILPTFPNVASLGRLFPTAVTFHRCKDRTLVTRLRERIRR